MVAYIDGFSRPTTHLECSNNNRASIVLQNSMKG